MEELIKSLVGKKVDISFGFGAIFRGSVSEVKDGVVYLKDEDDQLLYISVEKIASVYECSDSASRPGFIA
jgi:hypothetical protein